MKKTKRVKGVAVSMPAGIVMGTMASIIITGGSAALLTWLVLRGSIRDDSVGYFVMGIIVISSALGSILSAVRIKRRWMFACCLTGISFYTVLLISTAIFFGGNYRGIGVSALMVAIGSLGSGFLGVLKDKRRVGTSKMYRTR